MTALNSYHDLTEQGFNFWIEKGALKYRAPKGKMTADILAWLKTHKTELISLLATKTHYENIVVSEVSTNSENLAHPPMEDGQHSPTVEATPLNFMERNALLVQSEKPLFYHALDCSICNIEKARYCANGYAIGSVYDALLLVCEDAQARREDLALRIDRACISGRSVFEAFNPANVSQSPNIEPTTSKYGNTPDYEAFINHWTACEVCKPNLGRYCSEGQKLKEVADNSNVAF